MPTPAQEPKKTNREIAMGPYQDRQFADDEEFFGQLNADRDAANAKLKEYQDREESFSKAFTADHRFAGMFQAAKEGRDPILWLVTEFGPDIKERLEDPEFLKQVEEAGKEYAERVAENKRYEEEYAANVETSLAAIDQFQQENGLSDEDTNAVLDALSTIARDYVNGKITQETLKMVSDALNYSTDVANAAQEGEVKGRNAKIKEELRKAGKGDGTAHLQGANGGAGAPPQGNNMGAIGHFDGNDIFKRGGEKRTKYQ